MSVRIQSEEEVREAALAIEERAEHIGNVTYTHPNDDGSVSEERANESAAAQAAMGAAAMAMASSRSAVPGAVPKVRRNDPCPCGSGKKYKQCHGRLA
jgi:preprotein translocase subunit SecA